MVAGASANCSCTGFNIQNNQDLSGGDLTMCTGALKHYAVKNGVSSSTECCKLCWDDANCYAFTYADSSATNPGCYLKGKTGWTPKYYSGVVSGYHTSEVWAAKLEHHSKMLQATGLNVTKLNDH